MKVDDYIFLKRLGVVGQILLLRECRIYYQKVSLLKGELVLEKGIEVFYNYHHEDSVRVIDEVRAKLIIRDFIRHPFKEWLE